MVSGVSGDALFGRRARVVVGTLGVESEGSEGLRIALDVTRTLTKQANRASARIYNLSEDTRARLEGQQPRLTIEAGYEDTTAGIFIGNKATVVSSKKGVDAITTISASDGRIGLDKRVNLSFAKNTKGQTIVESLKNQASELFSEIKKGTGFSEAFDKVVLKNGFNFEGKFGEAVQALADDAGLELSIQSGEIVLLGAKEAFSQPGIVLSPGSGLIGTPTRVFDPKRPKAFILQGRSLLMPGLTPGRRIQLFSGVHDGAVFKIIKVHHRGDTHGGNESWTTDWQALSI